MHISIPRFENLWPFCIENHWNRPEWSRLEHIYDATSSDVSVIYFGIADRLEALGGVLSFFGIGFLNTSCLSLLSSKY